MNRCCQDEPFTQKVVNHAASPQDLQTGDLYAMICSTVQTASASIVDLERQNSFNFHQGAGDRRKPSIDRVRAENNIHAWVIEHRRRGGIIEIGLTKSKIARAGVETVQSQRQNKKTRIGGLINSYFMYLNHHTGKKTKEIKRSRPQRQAKRARDRRDHVSIESEVRQIVPALKKKWHTKKHGMRLQLCESERLTNLRFADDISLYRMHSLALTA